MKAFVILGIISLAADLPMFIRHFSAVPNAEICDNALDDDGDGLIDLNDPDCDCPPPLPYSLIPNPSFESQDCCPGSSSQMYCVSGWVQASIPTTDFLHACGWMGWDEFPPPLPLPDGEGCIGFRNGRPGFDPNDPQPNWKEYAGACLPEPLQAGVLYKVQFYVGFADPLHSPPINIAFYGAPSCQNLPFGQDRGDFGCPTNGPGWEELGKVRASGANNWQKVEIELIPIRNIEAIAIGPDCSLAPSPDGVYHFFDNLILAERPAFDFDIRISGNACAGAAVLEIPERDTLTYQWYKDGIALIGETGPQLSRPPEKGRYRVRLSGPNSCSLTEAYHFRTTATRTVQEARICAGSQYVFHGRILTESGIYLDTLKTVTNCDSIIELRLSAVGQAADTVYAKIFGSETWELGGRRYGQPGEYTVRFTSADHCDSIIHLVLDRYEVYIPTAFSPNADGINDLFTIYGGDEVKEIPRLRIFNRWGAMVFASTAIGAGSPGSGWDGQAGGQPAPAGIYVYQAHIIFDDGQLREVSGAVALVR